MEDNVLAAKVILTGIIAAGSTVWGWFGWLVVLWGICMALDYLTGTLAAIKNGEWSSATAREGLWHKAGMIMIVGVAALTDCALTLVLRSGIAEFPFTHSVMLTVIVLCWYTLTELGSMLENAISLSPNNAPVWLKKFLRVAASKINDAGEKIAREDGDDEKQS